MDYLVTRTIILVPIGKNVGLTTVSLGLIDIFKKEKNKVLFFKPCLEYFHDQNRLDDTSFIIKKYFLTSYIKPIYFNINEIVLQKCQEQYFIKKNLENYFLNKNLYDIILIEGIKNTGQEYGINFLNLNLANHLNAELIFVVSNDYNHAIWSIQKKKNI